jgi:hypothetical protein
MTSWPVVEHTTGYELEREIAAALRAHLAAQRRVTDTGLRRLKANWTTG